MIIGRVLQKCRSLRAMARGRRKGTRPDTLYFCHHGLPLRVEINADGEEVGFILDRLTGEFVPATDRIIHDSLGTISHPEISAVTPARFVFDVESARAGMVGTGPAFTLYEVVNALFAAVQDEDRLFTDEETARIESIYRETHALWQAGRARSD